MLRIDEAIRPLPASGRKRGEVTQFNQTGRDQVQDMDCSIAGIPGAKTRFALLPGHGGSRAESFLHHDRKT